MHEEEFNDGMQVEWAKACACMNWWKEELLLVQEEMRRVISYHQWKAAWWEQQSSLQQGPDMTILSGLAGYANKQAAISQCMAVQCAIYWLPHLKGEGLTPSWAPEYEVASIVESLDGDGPGDDENIGTDLDSDLDE